jgi:hypothetical protein
MRTFEYEISRHTTESLNQLIIFCSETGECNLEDVPHNQVDTFKNLLNERGQDGWELVDIAFGKDGLIAFWKREAAG